MRGDKAAFVCIIIVVSLANYSPVNDSVAMIFIVGPDQ